MPDAMPRCHCGDRSVVGLGYNRHPLYLCLKHHRVFQIARWRRHAAGDLHAELTVARRVLIALKLWRDE